MSQTSLVIKNIESSVSTTMKLDAERKAKVKKALHSFISDKDVSVVTDAQVYSEGKNYEIDVFASLAKDVLESKIKALPIFPVEVYIDLLRDYRRDSLDIKKLILKTTHSKLLNEEEVKERIYDSELQLAKSEEQAQEFLTHKLFKTDDAYFARVVVKRKFEVIDTEGNKEIIEKKVLVPGLTPIRLYEDTLNKMVVRNSPLDKPPTYWDLFSNSSSVLYAKTVYNPLANLYYSDQYSHFYINSYIEPEWKKEPDYYYLMQEHKKSPMTFNKLSPPLKTFLTHLFPGEENRKEVLKWCAFSLDQNLQTYLTLIGYRGIGKGIFVEDFLGYYHGKDNLNKPKEIEEKYDAKNANSTLLYFDELQMSTLNQYNTMKLFTNDTLNYQEKNQAIFTTSNYANVVWSCNTKDTMSAMSRDDRRFKIVPLATVELVNLPIYDEDRNFIRNFNSDFIKLFKDSPEYKREFVLLMLAIRDFVKSSNESLNDINTITENESRDTIFEESRSPDFIEILDALKTVYDDYDSVRDKPGKAMTMADKEKYGTLYKDCIPLSKLIAVRDEYYTYRIPFQVVKKVIAGHAGKGKPMSLRYFNRNLSNMPSREVKGYSVSGQNRDIEIRLTEMIERADRSVTMHDEFLEKNPKFRLINKEK